ncbi:MAG: SPOR domain-containing protein, partial [Bacteroidota bacterium]
IDPVTRYLWVACYTGSIMVYEDTYYQQPVAVRSVAEGPRLPIPPKEEKGSNLDFLTRKVAPVKNSLIFQDMSDSIQDMASFVPEIQGSFDEEDEFQDEAFADSEFSDDGDEAFEEQAVIKVKDEAPKPANINMGRPLKPFLVVVGSFATEENATNRVKQFAGKGVTASIMRYKGKFRLTAGGYDTKQAARNRELSLEGDYGIDAWVWEHNL